MATYLDVLKTQGRGVTGALLVVGVAVLYTMETWWLGWTLPIGHLLVYSLGGLAGVFVVTRRVGFRESEAGGSRGGLRPFVDFAELVVQSLAAAVVTLLAFNVLQVGDEPVTWVRLALIEVVPLGFGAAVANLLLGESDEEVTEAPFPENLPVFALGAVFITFPLAPTEEMTLLALRATWAHLAALVALSVAVVHLILHELEFRGQSDRIEDRALRYQVGLAFVVYVVGAVVTAVLLAGFGQFTDATPVQVLRLVVVGAFPASVGASGAEVVI